MNLQHRMAGMLAGLVLTCALAAPSFAAPKPPPTDPNAPGVVDLDRVLDEYRKTATYAKYQQRLADQEKSFNAEMTDLQKTRYSTSAERNELATLKQKAKPADPDKARIAELEGKSDRLDSELGVLSQKANPSADDTKRIQELAKMRADAEKSLNKEFADRQQKLRQLNAELTNTVQDELIKLVEKVAKDQKLISVFDRHALLVGGNDITDAVVKKLPK